VVVDLHRCDGGIAPQPRGEILGRGLRQGLAQTEHMGELGHRPPVEQLRAGRLREAIDAGDRHRDPLAARRLIAETDDQLRAAPDAPRAGAHRP
jgi:hypothetical protein